MEEREEDTSEKRGGGFSIPVNGVYSLIYRKTPYFKGNMSAGTNRSRHSMEKVFETVNLL